MDEGKLEKQLLGWHYRLSPPSRKKKRMEKRPLSLLLGSARFEMLFFLSLPLPSSFLLPPPSFVPLLTRRQKEEEWGKRPFSPPPV